MLTRLTRKGIFCEACTDIHWRTEKGKLAMDSAKKTLQQPAVRARLKLKKEKRAKRRAPGTGGGGGAPRTSKKARFKTGPYTIRVLFEHEVIVQTPTKVRVAFPPVLEGTRRKAPPKAAGAAGAAGAGGDSKDEKKAAAGEYDSDAETGGGGGGGGGESDEDLSSEPDSPESSEDDTPPVTLTISVAAAAAAAAAAANGSVDDSKKRKRVDEPPTPSASSSAAAPAAKRLKFVLNGTVDSAPVQPNKWVGATPAERASSHAKRKAERIARRQARAARNELKRQKRAAKAQAQAAAQAAALAAAASAPPKPARRKYTKSESVLSPATIDSLLVEYGFAYRKVTEDPAPESEGSAAAPAAAETEGEVVPFNWCRYCGARASAKWQKGPWGPKTLCAQHHNAWHVKKKLDLTQWAAALPAAPIGNHRSSHACTCNLCSNCVCCVLCG
jgi:hypothetical protein